MVDFVLKQSEFKRVSEKIYELCRISLQDNKKDLVQARLSKRLRKLGMDSFGEYLDLVEHDEGELRNMVDSITTNLTHFFREPAHFDYLRAEVFKRFAQSPQRRLRIWSAGCSSGEEPYSIAIEMREDVPGIEQRNAVILATDISRRMLDVAIGGVYPKAVVKDLPLNLKKKYFDRLDEGREPLYQVKPAVTDLVRFRYLNLMSPWPMKGKFDVIFCRNVMIYFDGSTREELIGRFWEVVNPGGVLIVGHSESLAGIRNAFSYVNPTIYLKE